MIANAITPPLNIPPDALVLELGSGHRPHPRADVLSDKYLEDIERGGGLVVDRPFIQTGAEQLPFQDKSFDFILCRHVLEHLENPASFFAEIGRVGRAGYIETPSVIWEYLHPTRAYHRWFILEIGGELVLMPRPPGHANALFGRLFETINQHSPEYRLFLRRYANLFYIRHFWQDEVRYQIDPADEQLRAWFEQPWDEAQVAQFVPPRSPGRQARDLLLGAMGSVWAGLIRRLPRPKPARPRHRVNLPELMQCPTCRHQDIAINAGQASCPNCGWHTIIYA